ncbi:conserved membrane hypothetical protein [Frankia canadensis]|uniref:ABC transporter domain-containing protein n=1 Tax=Frankia canadensis TaxID=1836972 RepID=A0A2I2KZP8_9ACTN|nr:branched-chain amino acid ABC transporter permease/ATP-binding protein [Frankia canadensis]SNQ51130.1 conserved membrane hypothetical protein [Frankia canadensis]SOU58420.1 conserved membrane hypothetical protein [Frankia canadensis]
MTEVLRFALLGLGIGSMYALSASGVILIYRASGVVNFAHGAIGMLGAYLAWELNANHGVTYPVAFVAGVVASGLVGLLTHLVVIRPLRRASALIRLVATLGVMIIIQAAAVLRYADTTELVDSALPTKLIHLGDIDVTSDRLLLLAIAAAVSVALALYSRTTFGLATAAVAQNQRAAATLGWSPDVIAAVNWVIGSALAGAATILIVPIIGLQVGAPTGILLAALAVCVVASFRSFGIAFAAGIAMGVLQSELTRYGNVTGLSQAAPFLVIMVMMTLRGRSLPLRDFMNERQPEVGSGRVRVGRLLVGAVVAIVLITQAASSTWADAVTGTMVASLILLSIVVVTGYAGQLSLGQVALSGVGAYIAGRLVASAHWPFELAAVVAVLAAVPIGMAFSLPALRTRGVNLAIITLGLGASVQYMLFQNAKATGGVAGIEVGARHLFGFNIDASEHPSRYAAFAFVVFVLAALLVAKVRRSRTGRQLLAVRTNERAAAALGIDVAGAKVYAFGLSSALAALGGIVDGFRSHSLLFSTFTADGSITSVGNAAIGGIGYVLGPIPGGTLASGSVGTKVSDAIFSGLSDYLPLISGVILILLLIGNQNGIVAEVSRQIGAVSARLPSLPSLPSRPSPAALLRRAPRSRAPTADGGIPAAAGDAVARRETVPPRVLEVDSITVRYGAVRAVHDVSFRVEPGQVVGLIGPNGAGKTTMLDAVSGFTPITEGDIRLDGRSLRALSAARRNRAGLSRSFQSLELFEDMTVRDNLRTAADERSLPAYVRDLVSPDRAELPPQVLAAVADFELAADFDRQTQDLSYGRRRLLAIARAVATLPSVLLLDEPAAGLSSVETAELGVLVRQLADTFGMGVLVIEHDMNFVMTYCDRVVVLDFGEKICEGTPADVRNDPATIAAYLGTSGEADGEAGGAPAVDPAPAAAVRT